jgi:DNA helicase II / ATP-dependent DNA helicase PcrA
MMNDDDLAIELGSRFDHVLVDEYQDTNRLQSKILLRLKPDGRGVTVVGDDAQSTAIFLIFRTNSSRQLASSPLNKITGPPNRFSTLATASSVSQKSGLQKTCGRNESPSKSRC